MSEDTKDRDTTVNGMPAPSKEEAEYELGVLRKLLDEGCATARDIVYGAGLIADVSHTDGHSEMSEDMRVKMFDFAKSVFHPMSVSIAEESQKYSDEEKFQFFSRMTTVLFHMSRINATYAIVVARSIDAKKDTQKQLDVQVGERLQPTKAVTTSDGTSAEEAVKKLLDTPIKSKYIN